MATPWLRPETGCYYIRRQMPEEFRPASGNKRLHKVSLRTTNPARAAILFATANGELEDSFEKARLRLSRTGSPTPSPVDRAKELVLTYFMGPALTEGGLNGSERLELARLELDRGRSWKWPAFHGEVKWMRAAPAGPGYWPRPAWPHHRGSAPARPPAAEPGNRRRRAARSANVLYRCADFIASDPFVNYRPNPHTQLFRLETAILE